MLRTRGLTLIEALLTAFLVFLIGSLVVSLLVQARAVALTSGDESEAAVDLQAASWLLTRELAESEFASLTPAKTPQGIAFVSARDGRGRFVTDAGGNPTWQHYLVYWLDHGLNRAVLQEAVRGPLPVARLSGLSTQGASKVSPNITDFEATAISDRRVVQLHLTWRGRTSLGKTEVHEVRFEVDVWN